jgi:CHAD domain-containing protein
MRKMRTSALRDTTATSSAASVTWPPRAALDCPSIFRKIAQDRLHEIRANHQQAVAGDPEAVHTMRIELTRFRAAVLFFQPWIAEDEWQPLNKELDWLNSMLGRARNVDVTVEYAARKRYRHWVGRSRGVLLRSQGSAHHQVAKALRSARYNHLILELDCWLKHPSPGDGKAPSPDHVNDFCEKRLRSWRAELSQQGRRVGSLGRTQQHRLRIQGKNYRYVVESLLDLNVPLSREDFTFCDIAKRMHQALGDLRDLRLLRRSIGGRPPHYWKRRRKLKRRIERLFR